MKSRLFGLDLMRCVAISLVILCHFSSPLYPFFTGVSERVFNIVNWISGYYGVEIFFVLSGFLIGTIYINSQSKATMPTSKSVVVFLKRRWLRTLPNYLLFVLVNVAIDLLLGRIIDYYSVIKALTFTQAINPFATVTFFGVSWSLAVEEWFYFLLPVSFLLTYLIFKNKILSIKISIALLGFIPFVAKITYCLLYPLYSNHEGVFRYATFFRLDAIFFGVFFAWLWSKENIKSKLQAKHFWLLMLGLFLLVFSFLYSYLFLAKNVQNSILYALFSPICCVAICLCLPFLLAIKNKSESLFVKPVFFVSTISYSLYLAHIPVKELGDHFLKPYLGDSLLATLAYIIVLLVVSISVSYFIYAYFELMFLKYRDRTLKEH